MAQQEGRPTLTPQQHQQLRQHHQQQMQENRAQQRPAERQRLGFFQGGLDALVTSISSLGDTLGQALEDGIQHVTVAASGSDLLAGGPEPSPKAKRPVTANPTVVHRTGSGAPGMAATGPARPPTAAAKAGPGGSKVSTAAPAAKAGPGGSKVSTETPAAKAAPSVARAPSASAPRQVVVLSRPIEREADAQGRIQAKDQQLQQKPNDPAALPKETQLMASRNVANAMAVRAKQLQADLRAARRDTAQLQAKCHQLEEENTQLKEELTEGQHWQALAAKGETAQLQARCRELEEENAKLKEERAEGHHWQASETEEQLREQVEHLLEEKTRLAKAKCDAEREIQQLHQLVEYYEELQGKADEAAPGWDERALVVNGAHGELIGVVEGYGPKGAHYSAAYSYTSALTPTSSSSDLHSPAPILTSSSSASLEGSFGMSNSRSGSYADMSDGVPAEDDFSKKDDQEALGKTSDSGNEDKADAPADLLVDARRPEAMAHEGQEPVQPERDEQVIPSSIAFLSETTCSGGEELTIITGLAQCPIKEVKPNEATAGDLQGSLVPHT